jgi:hypothetical protein
MPPAIEFGAPRHRWSHARASTGLVLALLCAPAHAEWELGATAGTFYDDNLTRAQENVDKRADGAATANVTGTNFIPLTGSDGVTFTIYGRGELFGRYSGLTNVVVGGTASYRHKFGLGFAAPWASVSVGTSYDHYQQDLRTSTRVDVRAEAGKRFTEQFDASAGVYYERRYDNHGESIVPGISGQVFDLAGQGAYVRAGYALTNALYLDAKAGVRRGDVESTSQRSFQIFRASTAIANDPAWGDPNLYAYRLRGTTWSGALTASYALSDQSSLDAEYRYDFTRAAQGLEYTANRIVLTFVHRF